MRVLTADERRRNQSRSLRRCLFAAAIVAALNTITPAIAEAGTVRTISVGSNPESVALNPSATYAYVARHSGGTSSVAKINVASGSVVATINLGFGTANSIAIDSTGSYAYVTGWTASPVVWKIDLSNNSVMSTAVLSGGIPVTDIALNAAGTELAVVGARVYTQDR